MYVDLPLDKKTVENQDWTGLGHRAAGPWGRRGPWAAGPSGRRATGLWRAVGRGPAFSKTPYHQPSKKQMDHNESPVGADFLD